ncbi:hypothetical protein IJ531_07175 [bacterium]|nr:hypothetical protein [bacterium]
MYKNLAILALIFSGLYVVALFVDYSTLSGGVINTSELISANYREPYFDINRFFGVTNYKYTNNNLNLRRQYLKMKQNQKRYQNRKNNYQKQFGYRRYI